MKANSKASGETAQMRRLAWSFAVCICPKAHFLTTWLKCIYWWRSYDQGYKFHDNEDTSPDLIVDQDAINQSIGWFMIDQLKISTGPVVPDQ